MSNMPGLNSGVWLITNLDQRLFDGSGQYLYYYSFIQPQISWSQDQYWPLSNNICLAVNKINLILLNFIYHLWSVYFSNRSCCWDWRWSLCWSPNDGQILVLIIIKLLTSSSLSSTICQTLSQFIIPTRFDPSTRGWEQDN